MGSVLTVIVSISFMVVVTIEENYLDLKPHFAVNGNLLPPPLKIIIIIIDTYFLKTFLVSSVGIKIECTIS